MADIAPHPIHVNRAPGAELYQTKLLLRRRSEIATGFVRLPSLRFKRPNSTSNTELTRDLVKSFLLLVGYAAVVVHRRDAFEFVAIVRLTSDSADAVIELYTANPLVVEKAHSYFENMSNYLADKFRDDFDVRHQYGIPTNMTIPVVFKFDPSSNRLTLTNTNHLADPYQFLDPERCRTTSGFLNFIGTLAYVSDNPKHADAHVPIQSFVNRMNYMMNNGVDEWLRWAYLFLESYEIVSPECIRVDASNPESFVFASPEKNGPHPLIL